MSKRKKLRSVQAGDYATVTGYRGIAFIVCGHEQLPELDEDGNWNEDRDTYDGENLVVVMVGDDRRHVVDPDDVTLLDPNRFCRGGGQIGCGHEVWS